MTTSIRVEESAAEPLVTAINRSIGHQQRILTELNLLVKQNEIEVTELEDRLSLAAAHVKQLNANLAMTPREELVSSYEELGQRRSHLITLQGQLEKQKAQEKHLASSIEMLTQLADQAKEMAPLKYESALGGVAPDVASLIRSEEASRRSLVRKMHDGPVSTLSNLILQTEICQRVLNSDPKRAASELEVLKRVATRTFHEVKSFILDLRPMMLDDLGLAPTLRRYATSFQEQTDIAVNVVVAGRERRISEHLEVTLFRSIQELLNNAHLHGRADEAKVFLNLDQDEITATVEDNGRGFIVDKESTSANVSRMGLATIQERLTALGGEMNVTSRPGAGTRVELRIPVIS